MNLKTVTNELKTLWSPTQLKLPETYNEHAMRRAEIIHENRDLIFRNANTLDSDLQRITLLQESVEEFAIVLAPLACFSVVFNNVPLEGTDKVGVPFYPLQTAASQSWNSATGYSVTNNTKTDIREIAVGGSGEDSGVNAAVGTAKDRKYQALSVSSYELNRQPFLKVQKLVRQNANKLATDIFKDIVSRVITAANFGDPLKSIPANAISSDDISDFYSTATGLNWPVAGRSLVLDHTYNAALIKDPTYKQYLSAGTTDALRKAQIQNAYGFEDIPVVPNLTTYSPAGENLAGWINWRSAVLCAFSPIAPAPEVQRVISRYEVIIEPQTGIALEYRSFGDATLDAARHIIESSYGAEPGVATALRRLTSQ